jgi:hypothetical protein
VTTKEDFDRLTRGWIEHGWRMHATGYVYGQVDGGGSYVATQGFADEYVSARRAAGTYLDVRSAYKAWCSARAAAA